MWQRFEYRGLWTLALAATLGAQPAALRAEGWVGPLSRLELAPWDLTDTEAPTAQRIAWARALGHYGPQREATAALLAGLSAEPAPSPPVLDAIVLSLAGRAPQAAIGALERLWTQPQGGSRESVAFALAAIGTDASLALLVDGLERPEARRGLLRAGRRAEPALLAALQGPHAVHAASLLGDIGGDAAARALRQRLRSNSPALRAAAARSLAQLGDAAAAPALQALLDDADDRVRAAALAALSELAGPAQLAPLHERYRRTSDIEQRQALLRALWGASPQRALAVVRRALRHDDERLQATARELVFSSPPPEAAPLLVRLAGTTAYAPFATSALARLPRGAGMAGLQRLLRGAAAPHAARALAIALREHGLQGTEQGIDQAIDQAQRERALEALSRLPDEPRSWILRALARDPSIARTLGRRLTDSDASARAAAAFASELLGNPALSPALLAQLAVEQNPEAFRRQAGALAALGAMVPLPTLSPRFSDPRVAPEALRLAAHGVDAGESVVLRRALRRALSSNQPSRVRVAAALALARIEDAAALPALRAALGDASPRVRLAATRALSVLGTSKARTLLRTHARVERNERVRSAALAGFRGAPALEPRGRHTLEARLVQPRGRAPSRAGEAIEVDVLLPDARWLRMQTLSTGELLLADLPPGRAELRVRE